MASADSDRRPDYRAATWTRPLLCPSHTRGTHPVPGCREGTRAGPLSSCAQRFPPSHLPWGPGAPCRGDLRGCPGPGAQADSEPQRRTGPQGAGPCCPPTPSGGLRVQALLTWHSQRVHASRFHLAPSACASPPASAHPAVLSRDSSFFIYKAKRARSLVVASPPSRLLPRRTRPGGGWGRRAGDKHL